jgi:2-C-methyl-D-erythritol 4-phosphate cytidylyltransferase
MERLHCTAIVLAAGRGTRMGTKVHKQYIMLDGRPVLYYSLKAFQCSDIIDEIYLVTGSGEEVYCREEIVEKYGITKVTRILTGGKERYHSVWNGLKELDDNGYVFIHDGARPFVDKKIIERTFAAVCKHNACVTGMPVKDTIKVADERGFVESTPDRNRLWMIQTPQVFENSLVKSAYSLLMGEPYTNVTDDAMVVEKMLEHPIELVLGSYENIKITTSEDLEMAEVFLKKKNN